MRRWVAVATLLFAGFIAAPVNAAEPTHLVVTDHVVGEGTAARDGMELTIDYTGWLYDTAAPDHHGTRVDSSSDHGKAITFTLGEGRVIAGWDKGIRGMRVGGTRTLLIPARLAYRGRGVGELVPPNAALVFDITLRKAH